MNSQFWVGCPTYWKDPTHNKLDVETFQDDLVQMISMGIGFNLYMFHGGTNFGLSAGLRTEGKYCLTSYDFDAPISESGDPTLKYFHIQRFITEVGGDFEEMTEEEKDEEMQRILEGIELPEPTEKGEYGTVTLTPVDSLLNTQMTCCLKSCISLFPKSMEQMNLRDGLMAYSTVLKDGAEKDAELRGTVRDKAYVILNNTETIGVMENGDALKLPKSLEKNSKLTFLVENQGRRPYKSGRTVTKGLFNMYLNDIMLDHWTITTFSIQGPKSVLKLQNTLRRKLEKSSRPTTEAEEQPIILDPIVTDVEKKVPKQEEVAPPAFYIGTFILPKEEGQEGDANEGEDTEDQANEDNANEDQANKDNANENVANEDEDNEDETNENEVTEDKANENKANENETNESKANEGKENSELNLESDMTYQDLGVILKDSYLNMTGWKKGIVYLNSFCLGRYWDVGPQRALFVPGSVLLPNPWKNKITILELEEAPKSLTVSFVTSPDAETSDVPVSDEPVLGQAKPGDIPREEGGDEAAEKVPSGTAAAEKVPNETATEEVPNETAGEEVPNETEVEKKESVP